MNSLTTFSAETGGGCGCKDYAGFVDVRHRGRHGVDHAVVFAAKFMPVWAAKGIAILVSFAVNFTITHFVVFRTKGERADAA